MKNIASLSYVRVSTGYKEQDSINHPTFDRGGRRCGSCGCESVRGGDLHHIGGVPQQARDFAILQMDSSIQLYRLISVLSPAAHI
jgi:hypothetical protein